MDRYTGKTVRFVRGPNTSGDVEIDHLVSLANAWTTGARFFDDEKRRNLANDPRNLRAVSRAINQTKGPYDAEGSPAARPRLPVHLCEPPARRQARLRTLGHTEEANAMRAVLLACPKPA